MRKYISKVPLLLIASVCFLASFAGVAFAADAATPANGSLLDLLKPLIADITSGHYLLASAAGLVLLVALTRRYLAPHWAFLGTDVGGALLALAGSFSAGFASLLAGGGALTLSSAWTALGVAFAAAGGYAILNKLLTPLEARAPAWMQPLFGLITWIFDEVGPQPAVAVAEAAGAAAVAANPAQGAKSAIGEATELK